MKLLWLEGKEGETPAHCPTFTPQCSSPNHTGQG